MKISFEFRWIQKRLRGLKIFIDGFGRFYNAKGWLLFLPSWLSDILNVGIAMEAEIWYYVSKHTSKSHSNFISLFIVHCKGIVSWIIYSSSHIMHIWRKTY
jgi:hypothetical protein